MQAAPRIIIAQLAGSGTAVMLTAVEEEEKGGSPFGVPRDRKGKHLAAAGGSEDEVSASSIP